MVKTPEKEEERKQNAKRKHHNAPLMNHSTVLVEEEEAEPKKMKSESSKRRLFLGKIPVKPRTPQIKVAKSSNKLAKLGFGHEKNHCTSFEKQTTLDDNDEEEEEVKKTQIEENFQEEEVKRTQIEENFEEEEEVKKTQIEEKFEEEKEVKKTQIEEKFYPSKLRGYFDRKENERASEKKNTILDDKEEELEKMRSKRRNLDGESRTPQTQIAGKSRIGYSIDGKKLPKPEFGYSIDGKELPKYPQIEKIFEIIGDCSKPFEKKLLKIDVDKIGFNRIDVKNGILPYLKEDETAKLSKGGIVVNTYDEFGNCYEMKFESYRNSHYKLCNGWKRLYKYHQLKENEDCYVAVWMFRNKHTDEVCFAVILKR